MRLSDVLLFCGLSHFILHCKKLSECVSEERNNLPLVQYVMILISLGSVWARLSRQA